MDPLTPGSGVAQDPDIYVYRQGTVAASGLSDAAASETISQLALASGTYIIEVYDYLATGTTPRCLTISVTGA